MRYKNLNHALKLFRGQVSESIPYAISEFPRFETPEEAFKFLKQKVRYKKDPKGVELFQTLPTLIDNNYHGITGAGDCDCFTIAALATLIANGFTDCGIVLVGRNPLVPVHIYAYVDIDGKREYFDLTNRSYNYERDYPYKQFIPYKLNQEEKNMVLQLADEPRQRTTKEVLNYLFIPSQGVNIREDYYDNLSNGAFQNMLLEEGYLPHEVQELSSWRSKRQARKKEKLALKKEKWAAKNEAKANKPRNLRKKEKLAIRKDRVAGRNVAKKLRGQAKILKQQQQPASYDSPEPQEPQYEQPYYEQPEYEQPEAYESEEYESVELTPEEQTDAQMQALFEGNTNVLGESVPKLLLIGVAATAIGFGLGYGYKTYKSKSRRVAA